RAQGRPSRAGLRPLAQPLQGSRPRRSRSPTAERNPEKPRPTGGGDSAGHEGTGGDAEVKSEWRKLRLDECAEIVAGATPSTSVEAYWDGNICWATPKDLSELDGAFISDTPRKLTRAGLENCAATILPAGSVLFSSRAPIG